MDVSAPEFDRDRGQVGIETLVVFIAMILVAAIAATVLINTAGFLQNKASATSQESQSQVSNQVIVLSSVGIIEEDNTSTNSIEDGTHVISNVSLTVMQSPGADAIDLGGSTVKWIGPDGSVTLTYNQSASATAENFTVTAIKDEDDSVPVLNGQTDRMKIKIELARAGISGVDALTRLQAGEEATIQIVTQAGSQYTYIADVPDTLSAQEPGEAVSL